jgi:hypothetical protein
MKLAEYLDALHSGDTKWPKDLTLPDEMYDAFGSLYTKAEKAGLEHGQFLLYSGAGGFAYGKEAIGYKDHMDIPSTDDPGNFGNVHAHPSESIGHAGGFSAHSIADLKHFEDTKDRGFFIQFVASGSMVYAMVYVKGRSTWDDGVEKYLGEMLIEDQEAAKIPFYELVGGKNGLAEKLIEAADKGDGEPAAAEAYLDTLKKQVPGYGAIMEKISVDNCKKFADKWGYGFFIWRDRSLIWDGPKENSVCTVI